MMFDYYPDIKVIVKTGETADGGLELRIVGLEELLPFAYVSSAWRP